MKLQTSGEVTRIVLLVLIIGMLISGTLWTMLPFLGGLIWAVTIVAATWPLLLSVQRRLGGSRGLAVAVMTLLVLLAFMVPFSFAIVALLNAAQQAPETVQAFLERGLGTPPGWLAKVPLVGERIVEKWQTLAAGGPEALAEAVKPYARSATAWLVAATGGVGITMVHVLLTVILVAILYAQGEIAAGGVLAFARRIGGERGEQTVRLAGQAVRSVALGVIVTALVQSALAGLGLWVSGVPRAGVLTAVIFALCVAQLGPLLVMAPAVIWLYWSGHTGWGTALLVWSVLVVPMDNFLRPVLIRRGVQLPMLLIIAGVIGGLIAFGVIGLFVGPVILAATYTLTLAWIADKSPDDLPSSGHPT